MDTPDDKDARPAQPPAGLPKSDASGASQAREARLAAALRANLRRRKAGPKQGE